MAGKRPATISSSSAAAAQGRIGSLRPPEQHDKRPAQASSATSGLSLSLAGTPLPPIAPLSRGLSPRRHAAPGSPSSHQYQQKALPYRSPPYKDRVSPARPTESPGPSPRASSDVSHVRPARSAASKDIVAVPVPNAFHHPNVSSTPAGAAAARRRSPRPSKTPQPPRDIRERVRQQRAAHGRRPSHLPKSPPPPPQVPVHGAAPPPPRQESARETARDANSESGAETPDGEEEPLTQEEVLLLCGVQPGSSKALWLTTMRAQLDARGCFAEDLVRDGAMDVFDQADSTIPSQKVSAAASSPSPPRLSSLQRHSTAAASMQERDTFSAFSAGPLQLPAGLLTGYELRVSHSSAATTATTAASPADPRIVTASPLSVRLSPHLPSSSSPTVPEAKDETGAEGVGHASRGEATAAVLQASGAATVDVSDEEHPTEEGEGEEEEDSVGHSSPPLHNTDESVKKCVSGAKMRLTEPPAVGAPGRGRPLNTAAAYAELQRLALRALRPSPIQLEMSRVSVLSLQHVLE